jgi:benzoate/toluate 1,2-dioxygenase alpha subunit
MARRVVGADEQAKEYGFEPVVSASSFADETLYHGEYRQWLKMMTEGLRREHA